jgi:hypothetical protein
MGANGAGTLVRLIERDRFAGRGQTLS